MKLNEHRKAIARALIQSVRLGRAFANSSVESKKDYSRAYRPISTYLSQESAEHLRGCTVCVATNLLFVDSLSENCTTFSNYGDLWMGLWLDSPLYLHDGDNAPSRAKGLTSSYHGNTLFPRWLAEVLNEECKLGIEESDIYDE